MSMSAGIVLIFVATLLIIAVAMVASGLAPGARRRCGRCGYANREEARFCGRCGQPMA